MREIYKKKKSERPPGISEYSQNLPEFHPEELATLQRVPENERGASRLDGGADLHLRLLERVAPAVPVGPVDALFGDGAVVASVEVRPSAVVVPPGSVLRHGAVAAAAVVVVLVERAELHALLAVHVLSCRDPSEISKRFALFLASEKMPSCSRDGHLK